MMILTCCATSQSCHDTLWPLTCIGVGVVRVEHPCVPEADGDDEFGRTPRRDLVQQVTQNQQDDADENKGHDDDTGFRNEIGCRFEKPLDDARDVPRRAHRCVFDIVGIRV
jgi:hypothetical protein